MYDKEDLTELINNDDPLVAGEDIVKYIQHEIQQETGALKELREYATIERIPILHPEVAKLLEVMVKASRPKRILEIGTAIGYSSILFVEASSGEAYVDTIEIDEETALFARENIVKAGCEKNINILLGDAMEVMEWIKEEYDMIFLDGPKGQYSKLLPLCLKLLKRGGTLVTDNIFYRGMVTCRDERIPRRRRLMVHRLREYIHLICNHEQLDTSLLTMGDGIAISVKSEEI